MSLEKFDERNPVVAAYSFTSTYTANTLVSVLSATDVPIRVDAITAVNDNPTGITVGVWQTHSGTDYELGSLAIAGNAGVAGNALADLLAQVTATDQKWIILPPGDSLKLRGSATPSGTNHCDVVVRGGTL